MPVSAVAYQLRPTAADFLIKLYAESGWLYRDAIKSGKDEEVARAVYLWMRRLAAAMLAEASDIEDLDDDLGIDGLHHYKGEEDHGEEPETEREAAATTEDVAVSKVSPDDARESQAVTRVH